MSARPVRCHPPFLLMRLGFGRFLALFLKRVFLPCDQNCGYELPGCLCFTDAPLAVVQSGTFDKYLQGGERHERQSGIDHRCR